MSSPKIALYSHDIEADFRAAMRGKMEPEKIETIAVALHDNSESCPAECVIEPSGQIVVDILLRGCLSFKGKVEGLTPGVLMGDLHTSNLDKLYKETASFLFSGTKVYFCILFFDSKGDLLGNFQAAAISEPIEPGGGPGKWGWC